MSGTTISTNTMPIIQVDHLTKKYRLSAMQSLKHTAVDDIAIEADSAANAFVGTALAAKTVSIY